MPRHWLLKSEPDVYSIDDLERDGKTFWNGVRNHAARNFMRGEMEAGDLAFFYHSNADPSGIVGVMRIVAKGRPDETQFDRKDEGFDPKSKREAPTWFGVDVAFEARLPRAVTLPEIKKEKRLAGMQLLKVSRLSVCPVTPQEWKVVTGLSGRAPPA